ncbi:Alpha/Beta hydrolase protein [Halenospora varia]|nr:Alpha/Beta hydrolase protein [Halenospora varia]
MPYITHPNGQKTYYLDDDFTDPWKVRETIVIQHGFARHAAFWYHWIPALSRHYRVIRRDARGHGLSSHRPFPNLNPNPTQASYEYSEETILDEIIDTLDQLGLEKVHFLGESTSGILGCMLAAKHPDRLHTLTICSSPAYLPEGAQKLFAFGRVDWPTACLQLGSRGWAQELSKLPGTVSMPDPAYVQWWIDQVSVSSSEGLAGYAALLCKVDCTRILSQITVPTLILGPMRSAATSVEEQKAMQARIPGAQLELIDAAGHEIYVQEPEACQRAFLGFLSKQKQRAIEGHGV